MIPGLTGLTGDAYRDPAVFASGFRAAMLISAALAAAGGVLAWLLIRNEVAGRADSCPAASLDRRHYCAVDGVPLATERDAAEVARTASAEMNGVGSRAMIGILVEAGGGPRC